MELLLLLRSIKIYVCWFSDLSMTVKNFLLLDNTNIEAQNVQNLLIFLNKISESFVLEIFEKLASSQYHDILIMMDITIFSIIPVI